MIACVVWRCSGLNPRSPLVQGGTLVPTVAGPLGRVDQDNLQAEVRLELFVVALVQAGMAHGPVQGLDLGPEFDFHPAVRPHLVARDGGSHLLRQLMQRDRLAVGVEQPARIGIGDARNFTQRALCLELSRLRSLPRHRCQLTRGPELLQEFVGSEVSRPAPPVADRLGRGRALVAVRHVDVEELRTA